MPHPDDRHIAVGDLRAVASPEAYQPAVVAVVQYLVGVGNGVAEIV